MSRRFCPVQSFPALAAILMLLGLCGCQLWHRELRPMTSDYPVIPPDNRPTVLVDAGHGGDSPGAVRHFVQEKEMNLATALLLGRYLEILGCRVLYTRMYDTPPSLEQRVITSRLYRPDVFVSVHYNATASYVTNQHGCEIYQRRPPVPFITPFAVESRMLAETVGNRIRREVPVYFRGIKSARFVVLRAKCPAILLEGGFISNPAELRKLDTPEFRRAYAASVALGICDFLREWKK